MHLRITTSECVASDRHALLRKFRALHGSGGGGTRERMLRIKTDICALL